MKKHLFDGQSMVNQMLLRGCHVSWLIYTWDERSSSFATWPALVRQFPWKPRGMVPFAKLADEGCKFEKSFWNCNFQYLAIPCNISDEFRCTACPSQRVQPSPAYHERRLGKHGRLRGLKADQKNQVATSAFQPLHE